MRNMKSVIIVGGIAAYLIVNRVCNCIERLTGVRERSSSGGNKCNITITPAEKAKEETEENENS